MASTEFRFVVEHGYTYTNGIRGYVFFPHEFVIILVFTISAKRSSDTAVGF
jgi:hypothetical protein